jgi:hypothetical protein
MEEDFDKIEGLEKKERDEIFSKAVRAGKRTYFFDVKATKNYDYYVTITESKKRFNRDGRYYFEKHKIFLYKEDFEKFADGLHEIVEFIKSNQGNMASRPEHEDALADTENFASVDFEDLDRG